MQDRADVRWPASILALLTLVVLLATPLLIYVRPGFAALQYRQSRFPAAERFADSERVRLSNALIDYLRHRVTDDELAALRTDAGAVALNAAELNHMADVQRVMDGFFWAEGVAAVVSISIAAWLLRTGRWQALVRGLRHGVLLTAALIGVILLSVALDFERFFTVFHGLFFQSGTWVFDYRDTLIQLYPLPFWVNAVVAYVITMLFMAALLWGLTMLIKRRSRV